MPDLGKKYTCYSCGAKFYNLNKPESICPKCGADQKDARSEEAPAAAPRPARRSMMIETIPDEGGGDFEESPQEDEEAREGELDDDDERVVDDRGPQKSDEEEY
jgi:hypothetical protein